MEFISHCIKRNPNKLEGRATAGMLIIFLVLSLLGWIYLTQASHVATTSRRNQELEVEKARLHQENMELMVEIATYESVSRLAARAQELGFVALSPDEADFVAVAAPAPGVPQVAPNDTTQARATDRRSGANVSAGPVTAEALSAGSEPGTLRSALGDVKSQFTAWVRASGLESATQ